MREEEKFIVDCVLKERGVWKKSFKTSFALEKILATYSWSYVFHFGKKIPQKLNEFLKGLAIKTFSFNEILFECAEETSSILNFIPHSVIKGTYLSRALYSPHHLRPSSDVDIMIKDEFFDEGLKILLSKGYALKKMGKFRKWATLTCPHHPSIVDITTPSVYGISQEIFSSLYKFSSLSTFSPEGHIIVILAHLRKNLFHNPLREIKDLELILEKKYVEESLLDKITHNFSLRRTLFIVNKLREMWRNEDDKKTNFPLNLLFNPDDILFSKLKGYLWRIFLERVF